MIVRRFTLFALLAFVIGFSAFSLWESPKSKYFPRNNQEQMAGLADGYHQYMMMLKANQNTGTIDPSDVLEARKHLEKMLPSKDALSINWAFKGPDNIGGRARAIIIDRNNSDHILAAGVAGGLYESFDGAATWEPYDTDFKITKINCITQDAAGDFYIGTGEHFTSGAAPNALDNKDRGYLFIGSGLHRLTGGGNFETIVEPDYSQFNSSAVEWATIGNIAADPNIPGKIYVAANQGFRVLERGQNGWSESSPINYDEKCLDVNIGSNGSLLVTFKSNTSNQPAWVYVSTDGQNWDSTSFNNAGRIEGAIAPSDPNIMYLSATRANNGCLYNIYRSDDAGQNWDVIGPGASSSFEMFGTGIGTCQGYWDNLLAIAPNDPGKIFVGGVTLFTWEQISTDPAPPNGSWRRVDVTASRISTGSLDPRYIHSDKHNMVFDPNDNNIAYIVTDGGVTKTENALAQQPFFLESNFNFSVTQYYNIAVNNNDIALGGTQDNGSHLVGLKYNSNFSGLPVYGGDGFGAEMSVINPQIGVASLYFNVLRRVQGIGTTLGNTNISRARIMGSNSFLGGLCNDPNLPFSCQGPFYTVTSFWESFNHEGSLDSAEILYERVSLPPIPKDTLIQFEGNNNGYLQEAVLSEDKFPFDTVKGELDTFRLNYAGGSNNRITANYDVIYMDTTNKTITVVRRGQADTLINYQVGQTYSVSNVISTPQRTDIEIKSESSLEVRAPHVTFRYRFYLHDKVQSILASANWPGLAGQVQFGERNLYITRDLLKNSPDIRWYNVAGQNSSPDQITSTVLCMSFSRDGNYLFAGTRSGRVYRISGLDSVNYIKPSLDRVDSIFDNNGNFTRLDTVWRRDTLNASQNANMYQLQRGYMAQKVKEIGRFTGRAVTDISVDPNNANNVVVSLGNYGNSAYVARTNFALTATDPSSTFEVIQGSGNTALPNVPSYSVLIDKNDSNRVLIGTDFGVFGTDNAFSAAASNVEWYEENLGMGRVPVFDLEQMVFDYTKAINDGKIYAGTHARGIFETDQFTSVGKLPREEDVESNFENGLNLYPNPADNFVKVNFKLVDNANVRLQVYSLNGRMVLDRQFTNQSQGGNSLQLDLSQFSNGTYIVRAISGDDVSTSKLLIYR